MSYTADSAYFAIDDATLATRRTTTKVTFETILTGSSGGVTQVANGYYGLNWLNFYATDPSVAFPDAPKSGYVKGTTSGDQVAFNGFSDPAAVYINGTFTLKSVNLAAAWDKRLTVEIYAYKDEVEKYHDTVVLTDRKVTAVTLNYVGVDEVDFFSAKGRGDPTQPYHGNQISFDDFVFADIRGIKASPVVGDDRLAGVFAGGGDHAHGVDQSFGGQSLSGSSHHDLLHIVQLV